MNQIIQSIENGKMRGYELQDTGSGQLIQYAVQKKNGIYTAYYFEISCKGMDVYEDEGIEEFAEFDQLQEAFEFLVQKGADLTQFAPFKGQKPF